MKPDILYFYMDYLANIENRMRMIKRTNKTIEKPYDGDPVVWDTPLNQYHLDIEKQPYWITTKTDSQFMISISVKDRVGVELASIKTNEFQVVRLIYNMLDYLDNIMQWGYFDSYGCPSFIHSIGCGTDTFLFKIEQNIQFYELLKPGEEIEYCESILYDERADQLRDLSFSINRYNNGYSDVLIPIIHIAVSLCDIFSFVDTLMMSISDIELSEDLDHLLLASEGMFEDMIDI